MSVIAVDAMGGDDAPGVVVEGAIEAAREEKETAELRWLELAEQVEG